ncbi:unnamed protein product [Larinioides sclopetarius]|uniref:Uncharacterized protein n=1 Tax=Larinioides sclopetarius TaxID=280406 RepID=A0AAV1ZC17_9ARAC
MMSTTEETSNQFKFRTQTLKYLMNIEKLRNSKRYLEKTYKNNIRKGM